MAEGQKPCASEHQVVSQGENGQNHYARGQINDKAAGKQPNQDQSDEWKPTKKGVAVPLEKIEDFIGLVNEVQEKLKG